MFPSLLTHWLSVLVISERVVIFLFGLKQCVSTHLLLFFQSLMIASYGPSFSGRALIVQCLLRAVLVVSVMSFICNCIESRTKLRKEVQSPSPEQQAAPTTLHQLVVLYA